MNRGNALLGASAGLALAVVLIVGVALAGGWSAHIDLIKTSSPGAATSEASTPGSQSGTAVSPNTGGEAAQTTTTTTASSSGPPVSSINGLESHAGSTIGVLLLPIVLGAVLGMVFFAAYGRRIGRE